VKQIIVLCLLLIHFASIFGVAEMKKLTVMMEHYNETVHQQGAISFSDFVMMHYVTDDGTFEDDARDSQLPFKSSTANTIHLLAYCLPIRLMDWGLKPSSVEEGRTYAYDIQKLITSFIANIWQPPQLLG
jgi:hypothetical protein